MLNPDQQKAAVTLKGPVLILAGAGSGKTKTLTERYVNIIKTGCDPDNILMLTFTNKAAAEMKKRISDATGFTKFKYMGTFHSIAVKILREHITKLGIKAQFSIYDAYDQEKVVKESLKKNGFGFKPKDVMSFISRNKNNGKFNYEQYEVIDEKIQSDFLKFSVVAKDYQDALQEAEALDFDDLLLKLVILLEKYESVRESYRSQFKYIMVDEYQDTNELQFYLLKLLTPDTSNICVVGDDYQSIYGFRGSNFRIILDFEKNYPNATIINLKTNYRSTSAIVEGAMSLISHNKEKYDKIAESHRGQPVDAPLTFLHVEDSFQEAERISELIASYQKQGINLSEMAILYRTNQQASVIEDALSEASIPYQVLNGRSFFDKKEVKDIVAYLKFINNPKDFVSLRRIINLPKRGVGDVTLNKVLAKFRGKLSFLEYFMYNPDAKASDFGITPAAWLALEDFLQKISVLVAKKNKVSIATLIDDLMSTMDYHRVLKEDDSDVDRSKSITRLINMAEHLRVKEGQNALDVFLHYLALVSDQDSMSSTEKVKLMTVHASKGLEFECVFVSNAYEGSFPFSKALASVSQIEEERRLMYVAVTRAKTYCNVMVPRKALIWGEEKDVQPSRFVKELEKCNI